MLFSDRLKQFRADLKRQGVDAFLLPHDDEYRNEYLPACNERLAYLTGFTGSAGFAFVTQTQAALYVDGRYTLQAAKEVSPDLFEQRELASPSHEPRITEFLKPGDKLGYDPWVHTPKQVEKLAAICAKAKCRLVSVFQNPVDAIWLTRPAPPNVRIVPHPKEYAGETSLAKRTRLGKALKTGGLDAAVLTDPAGIAWLLNVRGGDIPNTPLPLSFAILYADGAVDWFVDAGRLAFPPEPGVVAQARKSFSEGLAGLNGKVVLVDMTLCSSAVLDALNKVGATVEPGQDPCLLPKACKNPTELEGSRAAHLRDGVAVTRFLAWLSREIPTSLDEMEIVARLEAFRAMSDLYRGPSFDTIAGAGPNGAIVHYRATEATNRKLEDNSFLLLDSGAQYLDGTTDITRTIAIGTPTAEMRQMFTRVLKGHIALATLRFPRGVTGQQIDAFARQYLWQVGANYNHGTGHGVGSYLSVHEGPQRISPSAEPVELKSGMILSNEPGYYKPDAYGIRIENLVVVRDERDGFAFETLSLAPIDRAAIEVALLTEQEKAWLDAYHERVRTSIGPLLDGDDRQWLEQATAPL